MTIEFTSQSSGKVTQLNKHTELGQGVFGTVFNLRDKNHRDSGFVLKTINLREIKLNLMGRQIGWSRREVLFTIRNELKTLEQVGLLEGYQRDGDDFHIVMKKVEGKNPQPVATWFGPQHLGEEDVQLCVKALRELHRKGVAHKDCHSNNFLVGGNPKQAQLIDFGLAMKSGYNNNFWDLATFSMATNTNFFQVCGIYINEMVAYAKAHKFEMAFETLKIGALVVGAIYGIPPLAITHLMVRQFIYTMLLDAFAKEITSGGVAQTLIIPVAIFTQNPETLKRAKQVIDSILSCLSMYLMYSHITYRWMNCGDLVKGTVSSFGDKTWQKMFTHLTPEALEHTLGLFLPAAKLLEDIKSWSDAVMPEVVLKKETDLLYTHHPKFYAKVAAGKVQEAAENLKDRIFPKPVPAPGV